MSDQTHGRGNPDDGQSEVYALARDIAERRTKMPAYLVDDERWAEAVAEAEATLARADADPPRRPLFDGSGCGHPPDPVAIKYPAGWACHCGRLLDSADGFDVPEAPGLVVHCDSCGCHVAVPAEAS